MIRLRVALGLFLLGTGARAQADKFNWEGQVEVDAHELDSSEAKKRVDAVRLLAMDDIALSQRFLLRALGDKDLDGTKRGGQGARTRRGRRGGAGDDRLAVGCRSTGPRDGGRGARRHRRSGRDRRR